MVKKIVNWYKNNGGLKKISVKCWGDEILWKMVQNERKANREKEQKKNVDKAKVQMRKK